MARILSPIAIAIGVVLAFYLALNAYGDARYDAGKDDADAAWAAAAKRLEEQSDAAAGEAEVGAIEREREYLERVREEKEKVDAAIDSGGDPLDVLF